MRFEIATPTLQDVQAGRSTAPPLFANIVKPPSLADDVAAASLLVLGAIPAAFFILLAFAWPTPPACTDAAASLEIVAPSHAQNASAPRPRATPL